MIAGQCHYASFTPPVSVGDRQRGRDVCDMSANSIFWLFNFQIHATIIYKGKACIWLRGWVAYLIVWLAQRCNIKWCRHFFSNMAPCFFSFCTLSTIALTSTAGVPTIARQDAGVFVFLQWGPYVVSPTLHYSWVKNTLSSGRKML